MNQKEYGTLYSRRTFYFTLTTMPSFSSIPQELWISVLSYLFLNPKYSDLTSIRKVSKWMNENALLCCTRQLRLCITYEDFKKVGMAVAMLTKLVATSCSISSLQLIANGHSSKYRILLPVQMRQVVAQIATNSLRLENLDSVNDSALQEMMSLPRPRLRSLTLVCCSRVTDYGIFQTILTANNLTSVELRNCGSITGESVSMLGTLRTLRHLCLERTLQQQFQVVKHKPFLARKGSTQAHDPESATSNPTQVHDGGSATSNPTQAHNPESATSNPTEVHDPESTTSNPSYQSETLDEEPLGTTRNSLSQHGNVKSEHAGLGISYAPASNEHLSVPCAIQDMLCSWDMSALCSLNVAGCEALVDESLYSIHKLGKLRSLTVDKCIMLTSMFLDRVAKYLKKLTSLSIAFCTQFQSQDLISLLDCPALILVRASNCPQISWRKLQNLVKPAPIGFSLLLDVYPSYGRETTFLFEPK